MVVTSNLSTKLVCGGFGLVFLATDLQSTGTKAAVKVLSEVIIYALCCHKYIICCTHPYARHS